MLSVQQARDAILSHISSLGTERLPLLDAVGRVLAETVRASRQQPPWDNSAMDGFAVRSTDLASATADTPVELQVIEDLMAGCLPTRTVGSGQCSRIMTGAPVPPGADAVVRIELTREMARDRVQILEAVPVANDVRFAGEDQKLGDVLLEPGKVLRAAEIGILSSAPRAFVRVVRIPTVAILSTGDELCEPDETPHAGQIINTNAYALAALVKEVGAGVRILPIGRDNPQALHEVILEARGADVLLTSGGVSVGEHDFVKEVLESLGVNINFWKVRMTPGKPLAFGLWGPMPVFGLPGNPVSGMVSFELFVRPALLKMMGHTRIFRRMMRATLETPIRKRPGMPHFLRVRLREEGGRLLASSTGPQGSGVLRSMSLADALAVGEEALTELPAGLEVWIMPLDGLGMMSDVRPI